MEQSFIVLKDADGMYRPMAFVTPLDAAGEIRADEYTKKLDEGEKLVVVTFKEDCEY